MLYLGIDFGTTNSSIFRMYDNEIEPEAIEFQRRKYMPSVMFKKANGEWFYGEEAIVCKNRGDNGHYFCNFKLFIRNRLKNGNLNSKKGNQYYENGVPLKGAEYAYPRLIEQFFRGFLTSAGISIIDENLILRSRKTHVKDVIVMMGYPVIGVQSGQKEVYCDLIKGILERFGFLAENINFMPEPCLAAYGVQRGQDEVNPGDKILVFDCGGGTTDVAIMKVESDGRLSVCNTNGRGVAGVDVDKALYRYLIVSNGGRCTKKDADKAFKNNKSGQDFDKICEIKEKLDTNINADTMSIHTEIDINDLIIKSLSPKEFVESSILRSVVQSIVEPLTDLIRCSMDDGSLIKHVYLVGGSSSFSPIRDAIKEIIKSKV